VPAPRPTTLVFPDGDDWIVFAPVSRLALRTNAAAADRFRSLVETVPGAETDAGAARFAPTQVTISPTNACAQRCVYCYGTPAHANAARLDPAFCRAALEIVADHAAAQDAPLRAIFHGVGEPTAAWSTFVECVELVDEVARRRAVARRLDLCTGGQVSAARAAWIASRFDSVQVSIDGPADVQNRQRPRADGADALAAPLALARAVLAAGRRVCVKTTVTAATVGRLDEIVEFIATAVGPVRLDLGMMFGPPWVDSAAAAPPDWREFVAAFARAIDRGRALGVDVQHPCVSWGTLAADPPVYTAPHFCLAPPDVVTAFYDIPREGSATPRLGAYGRFDRARGVIVFDHAKRERLEQDQAEQACLECACRAACLGQGGVKGRIPEEIAVLGPVCQARLGVLKELLRRALPRRVSPVEVAV